MKNFYHNLRKLPSVCVKEPFIGEDYAFRLPSVRNFLPIVENGRKSSGFTLIELMVTLVIAIVLMTLAGPSLSTFIANTRMTNQANDLLADLNFARSEAIKRSAPVTVCKTANPDAVNPACNTTNADRWTAGRLIFVDTVGPGNGVIDAGDQVLKIRQEVDGAGAPGNLIMGFGDSNGTANRITFLGNGSTPHLGAQDELLSCDKRGDAYGLAVVIQTTGRVRVADRGKDKDGNNITACP